jgi:hypothetical protein
LRFVKREKSIREIYNYVAELSLDYGEIVSPEGLVVLIKEYIKTDVLFLHLNYYGAFQKVLPSKFFEYGRSRHRSQLGLVAIVKNV